MKNKYISSREELINDAEKNPMKYKLQGRDKWRRQITTLTAIRDMASIRCGYCVSYVIKSGYCDGCPMLKNKICGFNKGSHVPVNTIYLRYLRKVNRALELAIKIHKAIEQDIEETKGGEL